MGLDGRNWWQRLLRFSPQRGIRPCRCCIWLKKSGGSGDLTVCVISSCSLRHQNWIKNRKPEHNIMLFKKNWFWNPRPPWKKGPRPKWCFRWVLVGLDHCNKISQAGGLTKRHSVLTILEAGSTAFFSKPLRFLWTVMLMMCFCTNKQYLGKSLCVCFNFRTGYHGSATYMTFY